MFKPGERPDNLVKTQTSEENMLQTKEHDNNSTATKVQIETTPVNATAMVQKKWYTKPQQKALWNELAFINRFKINII